MRKLPLIWQEILQPIGNALLYDPVDRATVINNYYRWHELLELEQPPVLLDERIMELLDWLSQQEGRIVPALEAAKRCFLSESRFLHLFKEETGTTYRRLQRWHRLLYAYKLLPQVNSLTMLAHQAGFSDSAHFSRTFSAAFGFLPSQMIKNS